MATSVRGPSPTGDRLVTPSGAKKLSGQMPKYTPEQIDDLRKRFEKISGRKLTTDQVESVIDILGLSRHENNPSWSNPALYSPSNIFDSNGRIKRGDRYDQILRPYIEAAIAYSKTERTPRRLQSGDRRLHILGGTAGTGKSTIRTTDRQLLVKAFEADKEIQSLPIDFSNRYWYDYLQVPNRESSVPVDPDEAKQVIPEYDRGLAMGLEGIASIVHEESRAYAAELYDAAIAENVLDIVYDTSGQFNGNPRGGNNLPTTIEQAIDADYTPMVKYFFADLKEVNKRLDERKRVTGRDVPRSIVPVMQSNLFSIVPNILAVMGSGNIMDSQGRAIHNRADFQIWDTTNLDKPVLLLWWNGPGGVAIINKTRGPIIMGPGWTAIQNTINEMKRKSIIDTIHTINTDI